MTPLGKGAACTTQRFLLRDPEGSAVMHVGGGISSSVLSRTWWWWWWWTPFDGASLLSMRKDSSDFWVCPSTRSTRKAFGSTVRIAPLRLLSRDGLHGRVGRRWCSFSDLWDTCRRADPGEESGLGAHVRARPGTRFDSVQATAGDSDWTGSRCSC